MLITKSRRAMVMRSAIITPLYLIGSFFIGALLGGLVFNGLPGHFQDATKVSLAAFPALFCVIAGGALWGRAMARLVQNGSAKRPMWAGALGYGPAVVLAAIALTVLENLIVEQQRGPQLPIHVVFTFLFVPAVFLVATIGAFVQSVALGRKSAAARIALGSGLAAGAVFLLVDLVMDAVGYRVGAPGAAERATMVTVLLTGSIAASFAAGAMMGLILTGRKE